MCNEIEWQGSVVLVTFAPDAGPSLLRTIACRLGVPAESTGYACRRYGGAWASIHLPTSCDPDALMAAGRLAGVERIVTMAPGLTGRDRFHGSSSAVSLPYGVTVGASDLTVMAGPCSVESESQILEIADAVRHAGAKVLRGGVFKPRTSPYAFAGLGQAGLEMLALAGERAGLPVVTEAMEPDDVDVVARYADVIQVGSRNMANFPLLFRAGSHPSATPVLLKRGFSATIDEFVLAAEYVLLGRAFAGAGSPGLLLCERGIRTFEPATRFTLDVASIPILHERTHLPVIADPSHAAGSRRLVPPLALASAAAGADGLLIEVHSDPDRAWSDGAQALDIEGFASLMRQLDRRHGCRRLNHDEPAGTESAKVAQPV